ncbi:MAG: hypothetical protein ACTTH0_01335 [Eubacteriales bacterium]
MKEKVLNPKIKPGKDRLRKHLMKYMDDFVFLNVSDEILEKEELREIMQSIPLPIQKEKIKKEQDIKGEEIMKNLVFVLGIDSKFPYKKQYIEFLLGVYQDKIFTALLDLALTYLSKPWIEACAIYRVVLLLKPDDMYALYGYARVCREIYLAEEENEEIIGDFKAEAFECFEKLTLLYPEFSDAYFFLAYGYLNMGLYVKASLTFKKFVEIATDEENKKEALERISQIETPVKIEIACNDILAGRFQEGKRQLMLYAQGKYLEWWPLHYHMGIANAGLSLFEEAIANFKQVLLLSPSNIQAMVELIKLYRIVGNRQMEKKYARKIDFIMSATDKTDENKTE